MWIVARRVIVFQTQQIGFALGIARELKVGHWHSDRRHFADNVGRRASNKDQRHRRHVPDLCPRHVLGGMARRHVRDLVRHDPSEFGFVISRQDQSAVHVEETAGQRKGIHFVGVENLDGERHPRIGVAHQVLADAIDVLVDDGISDQPRALLDFVGQLVAQRNLAVDGIEIQTRSHIATPDLRNVVLRRYRLSGARDILRLRTLNSGSRIDGDWLSVRISGNCRARGVFDLRSRWHMRSVRCARLGQFSPSILRSSGVMDCVGARIRTDSVVVVAGCCASLVGWPWICAAALNAGKLRTVTSTPDALTHARIDRDDRAATRTDTITPTDFSDYETIPRGAGKSRVHS